MATGVGEVKLPFIKITEKTMEFEKNQNIQTIEQSEKDESKSFLGGVHHPWRRFFARTVDLMSSGVFVFFLFYFSFGYLFPNNIGGFVKFIENPIGAAIVLYALWIPVEALFLSARGTTPAKWVFGIRITSNTGEKLSYAQALKRTFLVFVQGDGFGIPLATVFTRLYAYRRLTKTGTTLWDTSASSVVTHKRWGIIRALASALVTFATFVVMSIFDIFNKMG